MPAPGSAVSASFPSGGDKGSASCSRKGCSTTRPIAAGADVSLRQYEMVKRFG
jgi:hypothetical protein